jgi:hypothetical protein
MKLQHRKQNCNVWLRRYTEDHLLESTDVAAVELKACVEGKAKKIPRHTVPFARPEWAWAIRGHSELFKQITRNLT